MNEYILDPRDSIRLLEDAVELVCQRTMIFFDLDQVAAVQFLENVPAAGGPCRALAFTCPDALLGVTHQVVVPETQCNYAAFSQAFLQHFPASCTVFRPDRTYQKVTCDQTGSHHRH